MQLYPGKTLYCINYSDDDKKFYKPQSLLSAVRSRPTQFSFNFSGMTKRDVFEMEEGWFGSTVLENMVDLNPPWREIERKYNIFLCILPLILL